jgi:hypothetical protein
MLLDAPWPQTVVAYAVCLFLYSVVWTFHIKTCHRCIFELHTGFFLILTAYDTWLYLVVFFVYTAGDIFVHNHTLHRAAAYGLLYFYAHTATVLTTGPLPFLCPVPILLIIGRLYRVKPEKKQEYSMYDVRLPPSFIQFLV